jgi:hypothetical protein
MLDETCRLDRFQVKMTKEMKINPASWVENATKSSENINPGLHPPPWGLCPPCGASPFLGGFAPLGGAIHIYVYIYIHTYASTNMHMSRKKILEQEQDDGMWPPGMSEHMLNPT